MQLTSLIAETYSSAQKTRLSEIMWGLVYLDGSLSGNEDYLIRKISSLIRIDPHWA